MKVLETILSFLTVLARILFPRRRKAAPVAAPSPCPNPFPAPAGLPLPPDARGGSDDHLHRSDTLALHAKHREGGDTSTRALNLVGCCLMAAGATGWICKWLIG